MAGTAVLAIDQGTHATRGLLIDRRGQVLARTARTVPLRQPAPLIAEQDPAAILDSVRTVVAELRALARSRRIELIAAGFACQRSSSLAWDALTGAPLSPVLSWLDRRSEPELVRYRDHAALIAQHTGLRLSPHYGAPKLRWLLDRVSAVAAARRAGRLCLGPLAGFLGARLVATQRAVVDHTQAARTLLFDLARRDWDPELLALFGIEPAWLPDLAPTEHPFGTLAATTIPLRLMIGDQQAALFGCGPPRPGRAVVNLGSGGFVLVHCGARPVHVDGLLGSIARSDADAADYLVEGTVNGVGVAFDWLRREPLPEVCVDETEPCEPPVFLNAIGGLGSPWWREFESRFMPPYDRVPPPRAAAERAVEESILFLLRANLERIAAAGIAIAEIVLTGGVARRPGLARRLAAATGLAVYAVTETEATARGVAWLAWGRPPGWDAVDPSGRLEIGPDPALAARYRRFIAAIREL